MTHPATGYHAGAAPELGPSQPRALKNPRPRLRASLLPAPMPTLSPGANKREVTLEEVSPLGRLAVDPEMTCLLSPSDPRTLSRTDPPAPSRPAPAPARPDQSYHKGLQEALGVRRQLCPRPREAPLSSLKHCLSSRQQVLASFVLNDILSLSLS